MGRTPCCDKANVTRGPWSPEEDVKLKDYIDKHGTGGNWIALPQKAALRRCGKSCRLRWLNYLRPNIRHGEFTDDEDRIISTLFANIGSRWSIIAAQLPGRTDNDIKNYWNTKLKKKLLMGASSSLIMVPPLVPHKFTSHHHDYDQVFHLMNSPSISFLQSPSSSSSAPPPSYPSPSPHSYNTYNHNNYSTTSTTSASISKSLFTGSYYDYDVVTPSIPNNISTPSSSSNNNQALMNDLQTKDDGYVFPMQNIPIINDSSPLVMFGAAAGDHSNSYSHADHHTNSCSSSDGSHGNNKDLAKREDDQQQFMMFSNTNGATGNHMNGGINNVTQEKHEITELLSPNIGGDQSTLIDYYSSLEEIKQLISSCNMSSSTFNSNITTFSVDENNKSSTTSDHHADQLEKGIMYY